MVRRFLLVTLLMLLTTGSGVAAAAEPPNQNDPCSRNGRDSCGTTGKGSYRNYRYGVRWFGDYRGAVPDVTGATFCIDLRFWYPGEDVRATSRSSAAGLKNKDGKAVSRDVAAPHEPGAVALRALQQRDPAGRGDALRAPADGRRRAR